MTQPEHYTLQQERIRDQNDWFLAIGSINLTSHLISYLRMNKANAPETHQRKLATRRAFKNFCRLNARDKKTFYEINAQMLMFLYASWLKAMRENQSKIPPNFQNSINSTMDCCERVLMRRDLRRLVDIRISFDTEIQLLGTKAKQK